MRGWFLNIDVIRFATRHFTSIIDSLHPTSSLSALDMPPRSAFVPIQQSVQSLTTIQRTLVNQAVKPATRLSNISRHFSSSTSVMAPTTKEYDVITIGGGSGGSGFSRRSSGWYGKKVAMIEWDRSGGTCVNVGYDSLLCKILS